MKNIIVIDDTPSKVEYLKKLANENTTVTFATTFAEARRVMLSHPMKFDTIYLDYQLDKKHTGVELLELLFADNTLKPGCRIKPNSAVDGLNYEIKKTITRLGLSRLQQKKSMAAAKKEEENGK